MSWEKPRFSFEDVQILSEETIYQGFFQLTRHSLRHKLFDGQLGKPIERELFAKPGAASALLYDPVHDCIGLVEQFRIGALASRWGPWTLEGVAGMVEKGEPAETMIRRELVEEAGVVSAQLLPITEFYPTPGSCDELVHLYCALCDLSNAGGRFGLEDEGEDIWLHVVPAQPVLDKMLNSRVNNAATLIGLLWLQLHRADLRERYGQGE